MFYGIVVMMFFKVHKDELMVDWDLALVGEQPYKIEPLR